MSGVVVFALDTEMAARLRLEREEHRYARRYVAIAARAPRDDSGTWDAPIGRAKDPRHRAVNGRDATSARTHFAVVARAGEAALLALAPVTGRTHQLRVHASHAGAPLLGDRVYGAPARVTLPSGKVLAFDWIALHAARVTIFASVLDAPIPALLRETWSALGGDDGAWADAVGRTLPRSCTRGHVGYGAREPASVRRSRSRSAGAVHGSPVSSTTAGGRTASKKCRPRLPGAVHDCRRTHCIKKVPSTAPRCRPRLPADALHQKSAVTAVPCRPRPPASPRQSEKSFVKSRRPPDG